MRRFALLVCAVAVLGCSESGNEAPVVSTDSAGISLADLTGNWNVRVMPETGDSVLTTYSLMAVDDSTWSMVFTERTDTIPIHIVGIEGDSIVSEAGPFPSALRADMTVSTRSVMRLQGGMLVGQTTARYQTAAADSLVSLRTEGARAN
jgi:hypothetical protein